MIFILNVTDPLKVICLFRREQGLLIVSNNSSLVEDNQGLVTVHLNEKHEIIQGSIC